MRPVLHSDLASAARALLDVPQDMRAAAADRLVARADAADRYRRRFGRAHAMWGNGTLLALASRAGRPAVRQMQDPDHAACMVAILSALIRRNPRHGSAH